MPNLVICCDGTWNTPDQLDQGVPAPTNVVRLYNAVADFDAQGAAQTSYYHPGVGTNGNWWDKAVGGGTGAGLDDNIMSAYQKLCMRSMKHTYRQMRFPFTVAFPVSSSTAAMLHSRLLTAHAA
ncbi:DUF2235 domain-containing protein, partial [Pseudomonas sp. P2663]